MELTRDIQYVRYKNIDIKNKAAIRNETKEG